MYTNVYILADDLARWSETWKEQNPTVAQRGPGEEVYGQPFGIRNSMRVQNNSCVSQR